MVDTTQNGTDLLGTDGKVIGALIALYNCQEADEKSFQGTVYQNGAGFNMIDAPILSDIARYYLENKRLSPKQLAFVKGRLGKYLKQLSRLSYEEMPNRYDAKLAEKVIQAPTRKADMVGTREITITMTYDPRLVDEIKKLPGRRWDSDEKVWRIRASYEAGKRLMELGFEFGKQMTHWWSSLVAPTNLEAYILPEPSGRSLFPFQREGVAFIDSRHGRALIADEMGLGKTPQSICWLYARRKQSLPAVVICPASLKPNWEREIRMWTDLTAYIISGTKAEPLPPADVYIINYDIVAKWKDTLRAGGLKTAILDESHYIKTPSAGRTLAVAGGEKTVTEVDPETRREKKVKKKVLGLCTGMPHVICLTGTPILNRPIEIFTSLSLIRPDVFSSFWRYAERYCGATNNGFGWEFNGSTNAQELHEILTSTIMLRRLKKDVLRDLPPKMRMVVPMEIANRSEYRKAEDDFLSWVKQRHGRAAADAAERAEALVRIEKLKQLAFTGKFAAACEWIEDYLEQNDKLVVFGVHKEVLNALERKYASMSVKVNGDTPVSARQEAVDRFQNDPSTRLFLGNIKAAGVGLTLTAASATCFLELEWTPGLHDQAEDRVHRIGQEADSVFAYYLLAEATVEEEIASLIDSKRRVLDAVLDGKGTEKVAMLTELMNKMLEAA